jgi:hypothetical protein
MAFDNNITPGAPPLLWSNVEQAFARVNENFDILVATVGGGSGLTPIDFGTLDTDVSPAADNTYALGELGTKRWKSVFLAEYQDIPGEENNGVYIGSAQIKGVSSSIELPANSTVVGVPIKEPFFNSIQVDNSLRIEANSSTAPWGETVNLNSGTAMQLVVSSGSDSITFNNTGVTRLTGTANQIGVSGNTGNITLTNLGVLSLTSTTALPSGRTAGNGINISASTGSGIKITNTGVLSVESNTASLLISTDSATGIVTITNNAPAGNAFRYAVVDGDGGINALEANSANGILNFVSGAGINLVKNTATDTITINVNPEFDLNGSVFSDGSTMLVDGTGGRIVGPVYTSVLKTSETKIALGSGAGETAQGAIAVAIGNSAGESNQGSASVAIGYYAGKTSQDTGAVAIGYTTAQITQRQGAVAIGWSAGQTNQGANSIAIGYRAGFTNQNASSIVLNASGTALEASAAGFFVNPVRNQTGASGVVQYNSTTSELSYSSALGSVSGTFTGNIFTSLIDSSDSSAITVTPATIFSSNVNIENELTVSNGITFSDGSILKSYRPVTVVAATTTAQTVNDGASASYIQFIETVDTAGAYSPGVFTAPYTGYYQVNLSIYFSTTVTLNPGSFFLIDSNPDVVIFSGAWTGSYLHYSTVVPATAGDAIGFVFRQVSGAAIDISSGSRLTIHRVSIGA